MKLNRAIDILSKLRYNASLSVLKTIYHSLFGSHLLYGSQIWRQKNIKTQTTFQTLQNRALKKMTFKNRRDSAICIYKDLKILTYISHNKTVFLCFHLNKILNYFLLLKFFPVDTLTTTQQDQLAKMF